MRNLWRSFLGETSMYYFESMLQVQHASRSLRDLATLLGSVLVSTVRFHGATLWR
jgi:hypothetical protein